MKAIIPAIVISAVMSTATIALTPPAMAQVGVSINLGDVALGYRDGYWDSHHHWHHWSHPDDYKTYSHAHPGNYHDYNHDRDNHGH
jgi:beta-galactosidase GanA